MFKIREYDSFKWLANTEDTIFEDPSLSLFGKYIFGFL